MAYAADVTSKGIELFAKILANKADFVISRVMVGSGTMPEGSTIADMEDLVYPVAAATSDAPSYKGVSVNFTIEYRSDLNGGLENGFYIREYGVFVRDPTDGGTEVLVFYGNLSDYPQYVSGYSENEPVDVRRFPVAITIGRGQNIVLEYEPSSFMTENNVTEIVNNLFPTFLETDVAALIAAHNASETAHPDIRTLISGLETRIAAVEMMYMTNVNGNQFSVYFDTLDDTTVTGVWNASLARMEF